MGAQLVHVTAPKEISLQQRDVHKYLHGEALISQQATSMHAACINATNLYTAVDDGTVAGDCKECCCQMIDSGGQVMQLRHHLGL